MDIKKHNTTPFQPSFKRLGNVPIEAEKLLKKADRIVKSSNAKYMDVNIPEGHKKPLWSVLSEFVKERQKDNDKFDIFIDLFDKAKQLLSVRIKDSKNNIHKEWIVNPMPVIGKYNDVFPPEDFLTYKAYRQSLDPKTYGRSPFFDIIDTAEAHVEKLQKAFSESAAEAQTSIRAIPKSAKNEKTLTDLKKSQRAKEKKAEQEALKQASKEHTQRPFEALSKLIDSLIERPANKSSKSTPKEKSRIPRKLKKEIKQS